MTVSNRKPTPKTTSARPSNPVNNRSNLPVWAGPSGEGPSGGVTQSLLGRYLTCPERFRLKVIDGIVPADKFSGRMEFGNLWHAAEEVFTASAMPFGHTVPLIRDKVSQYAADLARKYPFDREEILKWREVVFALFPVYVAHWRKHPDAVPRTPLMSEQVFDVPYRLPSGRTVRLRGKWDNVAVSGKGTDKGIWVTDHKTKQRIDEQKITRQLTFDLQTMVYFVALQESQVGYGDAGQYNLGPYLVKGIRYNVVRRTEHRVGKKETLDEFCDRLRGVVNEDPRQWFMRWDVPVRPSDVTLFKTTCLDPVLENLCDDYEWWMYYRKHNELADGKTIRTITPYDYGVRAIVYPKHTLRHYRRPFGVYDVLAEGGATDLDQFLESGSMTGLTVRTELFPELK